MPIVGAGCAQPTQQQEDHKGYRDCSADDSSISQNLKIVIVRLLNALCAGAGIVARVCYLKSPESHACYRMIPDHRDSRTPYITPAEPFVVEQFGCLRVLLLCKIGHQSLGPNN